MSDQADNPYAPPRGPADTDVHGWGPSPPREYRCRKSIRWVPYVFLVVGVAVVLDLGATIASMASFPVTPGGVVLWAIWAIVSLGVLAAWWALDRMASVSVVLEDSALVYRHRGGVKRLSLDQTTSLSLDVHHLFVDSLRLRSADDAVTLTVRLEGISELVLSLKAALDIRGLAQSYDYDQLFRFFRFAAYQDESRGRLETNLWKFLLLAGLSGCAGALLAFVHDGGRYAAIWAWVSAHWPLVIYAVADHVIFLRFKRRADKNTFSCPPSDPLWVRSIYRKALGVGVVFYAVAAAVASFI